MFTPTQPSNRLASIVDKLDPTEAWRRSLRTGVIGLVVLVVSALAFVAIYRASRSEIALLAAPRRSLVT